MIVVALKERGEFEGLRERFEASGAKKYSRVSTATGGELLQSPEGASWPHLAHVTEDVSRLRTIIQWVHRNWPVSTIVSSGLIQPFTPEAAAASPYFLPKQCYRAAGRIDIGGAPLLYEQIAFDGLLQSELSQAVLRRPIDGNPALFGADRDLRDPTVMKWLNAHLDCSGSDTFTAELLGVAKRFGTPVGCLKVFENARNPIESLQDAWAMVAGI